MLKRSVAAVRISLERLLVAWLVLFSLLAYYWDVWFIGLGDPFVASRPWLNVIIAATMFAIGSLLPRDEIEQVARKWPTVLGGTTVQYLSMPLLAYGVGRAFGFEGPLLAGVIMTGCVPGAMASNVLTLAAGANVSYSVSLTTTATLLSPLMVPLALQFTLGQWRPLPAGQVSFTLLVTVVLPVVAGYALSRYVKRWETRGR